MTKIRGGFPPRPTSYWNSHNSGGGGGGRDRGGYTPRGDRYNNNASSRNNDYNNRSYNNKRSYNNRDSYDRDRRSGGGSDYKRMRIEASSSRHDNSYGGGYGGSNRYDSYAERNRDRHSGGGQSRRDDYRRPMRSAPPPPRSPKGGASAGGGGGYNRGRMNSRNNNLRTRDRPPRRRLLQSSYAVNKRVIHNSNVNRRLKMVKIAQLRSVIARRIAQKKDSDVSRSSIVKDEKKEKEPAADTKKEKPEAESTPRKDAKDKDKEKDKDESMGSSKKGDDRNDRHRKSAVPFIKLICVHCDTKSLTFSKYDAHLQSRPHMSTMKRIAFKQKNILRQMRLAQRNTQGDIEAKESDNLPNKTNFCPLCKLIYRQDKQVHQSSEGHRNMKKFLLPQCTLCNKTFKSPMMYENHCCSIEHIMMKQTMANGDESTEEGDLKNFTTIDSIEEEEEGDDKKQESKSPVYQGMDHIRVIEAHFCDLCKIHLFKGELEKHCMRRMHRTKYLRWKKEQEREKDVKSEDNKEINKEKEKDNNKDKDKEKEGKVKVDEVKKEEEDDGDGKIWDEVENDIGAIIADGEDDDEDVNGERYDRFKLSDKNEDEKGNGEAGKTQSDMKAEPIADA